MPATNATPVIHAFHAGRDFNLQHRLAYARVDRTDTVDGEVLKVAFVDVDRQAEGVITLYGDLCASPFDDADVLHAVDQGDYDPCARRELLALLKAAAEAL